MIQRRVVFVLGAGASIPYGYPSGKKLVQDLGSALTSDVLGALSDLRIDDEKWKYFQSALRGSDIGSIDTFLERRPDLYELGKLLLAIQIIRCEEQKPLKGNDDHWYPILLDALDGPFDELNFSNAGIVTFNYDRSLEEYLFRCLCHRHNRPPAEISRVLATLEIVHVYGSVGKLDWQSPDGRSYSDKLLADVVRSAAAGIKIISEGREDSAELKQARRLLATTNRIIFLGMSYNRDNMRRIGFPRPRNGSYTISGSMYGMTSAEQSYLKDKYGLSHWGSEIEMCCRFLRNNPDFIRLCDPE